MHSTATDLDVDLVCWSRHRWRDADPRVQQLMVRFAQSRRVFFVEEAVRDSDSDSDAVAHLEQSVDSSGVRLVVPHLPLSVEDAPAALTALLRDLYVAHGIRAPIAWYDTPLFLAMTRTLPASVVIYDCIDDVAADAPLLAWLESELFSRAHLVFVSGRALHEHVRERHPNVRLSPSSIDLAPFARARADASDEPPPQASIAHPRIGFLGAVDARVDVDLIARMAAMRPAWQFVCLAPSSNRATNGAHAPSHTAALAPLANVHLLAAHADELARYVVGWDVGFLPYAINERTRFMSATRAPELLAAGLRVVATPVPDVVSPYGEREMVRITRDATEMVAAIELALAPTRDARRALSRDLFLATMSWDTTFEAIVAAIDEVRPTTRGR